MLSDSSTESREAQLLIALLRQHFSRDRGRSTVEPVTEPVIAAACRHGVVPLLHRAAGNGASMRAAASDELSEVARRQWVQTCALASELARIARRFGASGIETLTLKGPALSMLLYGEPTVRRSCDLDILVRRVDVEQAARLLHSESFVELPTGHDDSEKDRRFYREADGITVELHWAFHPVWMHIAVDEPGIWARSQTVSVCGQNVRVLSVEDTLIYLSIHGAHHRWDRLKWVCDVAQILLVARHLDAETTLRRAASYGCRRMLLTGVALASSVLGVEMPAPLARAYQRDGVAQSLVEKAKNKLLSSETTPFSPLEFFAYRERLRDRLIFIRERWRPSSADVQAFPLPARLSFLYYLTRPIRLLKVYGTGWSRIILWDRP